MSIVLVISTLPWIFPARLVSALQDAGLTVEAACYPGNAIRRLRRPPRVHRISPVSEAASIISAITSASPDVVIPCDDRATAMLHRIHRIGDAATRLLIEKSIGNPDGFDIVVSKRATAGLARKSGLSVPDSVVVESLAELRVAMKGRDLPVVLKRDGTWGGKGVRILRNASDLETAWSELVSRSPASALRSMWQRRTLAPAKELFGVSAVLVDLQTFISGAPANRAVLCDRGRVIAGISVIALETQTETGAASVVRICENVQMSRVAEVMAGQLGISGLCGFDFMICRETGNAMLLEINARATPICHLAVAGQAHLPSEICTWLTGGAPLGRPLPLAGDTVMLFPNEIHRDPQSPYLRSASHDVPWDQPGLLELFSAQIARSIPQPADFTSSSAAR